MRRDVFQAIADPIRRDIIELLAEEALTVNSIAEKFEISRPAVSKHLKILQECKIIDFRREGREKHCFITPENLIPAFMWIEQYRSLWESKMDSFDRYLTELKSKIEDNE